MKPEGDLTLCSDATLLLRMSQSDKEALLVLYDRYAADIYAYSIQLVREGSSGKGARDAAQKILIDVFASLWDNRETLSASLTLVDHLYSMAYNGSVNCRNYTSL